MNDITKSRIQADREEIKAQKGGVGLRIIGYLLALVIGGAIVCFVMGLVRTFVQSLVIVGVILLAVALVLMYLYHSVKWHTKEAAYKRVLRKYEEIAPDSTTPASKDSTDNN